jgi:MscS family membrane protein
MWARYRQHAVAKAWSSFVRPLWLVLGTSIHSLLVSYLRIPVLQRHHYQQIAGVIVVIGSNWLLWRFLREGMRSVRQRAVMSGRMETGSLMILGERVLKAAIFVLAIFTVLGTLGFNLTTPLAGLGIGGIAVAFAAQKTLENLFGGVSLLGDEVIRIGDVCRFGDRTGTVEDISLRSTRIRTPDRTELSIPNGSLATMNLENLSRRDKFLFNTKLGLRYETSPDQMRYVLVQVRRLLYEHPKVETDGARNRFIAFDASALTLEFFAILTQGQRRVPGHSRRPSAPDHGHCGRGRFWLRLPSQTVYLARDTGVDKEKAEHVARQVQKWRGRQSAAFSRFQARRYFGIQ